MTYKKLIIEIGGLLGVNWLVGVLPSTLDLLRVLLLLATIIYTIVKIKKELKK